MTTYYKIKNIYKHSKYTYSKIYKKRLLFKFSGVEKIKRNYSQAFQDIFILTVLNGKKFGKYLEVGGYHGKKFSNTYLLEKDFKWTGFAVENVPERVERYNESRRNKCLQLDATKTDFKKLLDDKAFPKIIDFLQIDIDPFENSKKCLLKMPFENYTFLIISFETDVYRETEGEIKETQDFLKSKGYRLLLNDVSIHGNKFEDWYLHESVDLSHWKVPNLKSNDAFDLFINKRSFIFNILNLIYVVYISKFLSEK